MTRSGTAFPRPPLVRLTFGGASSSWDGDDLIPGSMFPTPNAAGGTGYMSGTKRNRWHPTLESYVRLWPTPTAGDAKSSGSRNLAGSKAHPGVSLTDAVVAGGSSTPRGQVDPGRLNPTWVEWLMGFPLGWTDLGASETRSSRKSSKSSDDSSSMTSSEKT